MVSLTQSVDYIGLIGDVMSGLLKIAAPQEVAVRRRWKPHSPIMLGTTAEMIRPELLRKVRREPMDQNLYHQLAG
jgi:hypothetical protein